jgi:hypothetical protein
MGYDAASEQDQAPPRAANPTFIAIFIIKLVCAPFLGGVVVGGGD